MALFKLTAKRTASMNGVKLEKGMSAEVSASGSSPFNTAKDTQAVQDAFMRKYGIDLKKGNMISSSYFDVLKIS
jgi:stage V sporulation protein SpoVS